jgi:hypothetical protein
LLARVPFALADMEQAAGGELAFQPEQEVFGQDLLGRTQGGDVPFGAVHVVDRDEGRLPTHRQTDIVGLQLGVDLMAEHLDRLPLLVRVGLGDARILMDARDAIVEVELHLARFGRTRDGCSAARRR